jgi:hypothetical protein
MHVCVQVCTACVHTHTHAHAHSETKEHFSAHAQHASGKEIKKPHLFDKQQVRHQVNRRYILCYACLGSWALRRRVRLRWLSQTSGMWYESVDCMPLAR